MRSAAELGQEINALVNGMANLIRGSSDCLRRCERKLVEFKRQRNLEPNSSHDGLTSEIVALLSSSATIYGQAILISHAARTAVQALVAQTVEVGVGAAEAKELATMCQQTERSLDSFEIVIAQIGQNMKSDLALFRRACSDGAVMPEVTLVFQKLMVKVGVRQGREG